MQHALNAAAVNGNLCTRNIFSLVFAVARALVGGGDDEKAAKRRAW